VAEHITPERSPHVLTLTGNTQKVREKGKCASYSVSPRITEQEKKKDFY